MPQITPIRGFTNTPVTKAVCTASIVFALALLVLVLKQYVNLTIDPFIVTYSQYWRVATFQFSVVNESDLILTIVLWFHFKTLERLFGPRKYFSLVTLLALYNAVGTFLTLCIGQLATVYFAAVARRFVSGQPMQLVYYDTIFNSVVPGPLGILALLYICHGTYIPVLYRFKILLKRPVNTPGPSLGADNGLLENGGKAITLTNHFQVHFVFTLLMLNHGFKSLLPVLVGVVIGLLYTKDLLLGSRSWVLPSMVFQLLVAPHKLPRTIRTLARRWQGYQRVAETEIEPLPTVADETVNQADEDELEVAIDDLAHRLEVGGTRSTSPVRPLGRQFLDTFRT
ncbi:hypothetical protein METBIDRAFT_114466 [Metschnikowia bicuspidata var. bicuspidata NRRL YB-4993]|uniref:Peptidase S54 rhomboid domain-containing protein n=1 Tax=Metschnikowia bicuspidata var. bicuspidata NRRL YB-4993 TaxID=869754 RepID=A0A1A0HIM8_9ASCO|nr:hypothetical protein METBIDRAFT_114466 [Metschnikowia bicuspidata var. bicuspidata NRRL YB-4993]OBA23865.1 hypothetical protein METBIDRAFT_114466 [Metschnikowia bicuspidata var. bicuspidata NRRL YB-4993]